jgi:methyl-accepting chemotaxis protein/cytochrome b561
MSRTSPSHEVARYPRVLRFIHWSFALLVLGQFGLILVLHSLKSLEFGKIVLDLHRQCGTLVLLLILARFGLFAVKRAPKSEEGLPFWQKASAVLVHLLLMGTLAAQPIIGMIVAWSRGDDVTLFHAVTLPKLLVLTNEQGVVIGEWHKWLAYAMIALLAVHIGAVVFNHVFRRVPIVERMLAAPRADQMTNRVPLQAQLGFCCMAILSLTLAAGVYSAHKYAEFNELQSAFDQGEAAMLEELRAAQLAAHSLGATPTPEAITGVSGSLDTLLPRLTDATVRGDAEKAAQGFAAGDLADATTSLDSATDGMAMVVFQRKLDLTEIASQGHDLIVLTLAPTVFISALIGFLLSRSILQKLGQARRMVRAVGASAQEDDIVVRGAGAFAQLVREIIDMRHQVQMRERDRHEQEAELAREHAEQQALVVEQMGAGMAALSTGNLTFRIDTPFDGASDQIRVHFNEAMESLEGLIGTIVNSSGTINSGSMSVVSAAESLAERTERQANSLNLTAGAIERLTSEIQQSSDGTGLAANSVRSARAVADGSRAIMADTIAAMSQLENSAREIMNIVVAIDAIAFQTNMLALNAGVEAARAGQAGAGFAIVAQEVRALAKRAGEASDSVRTLVTESTGQITTSVDLVRKTSTALQQIIEDVGKIDGVVHTIAGTISKQADEIGQINGVIHDMDNAVQQNAAMAEEATAAASMICTNSSKLDSLVGHFRVRG